MFYYKTFEDSDGFKYSLDMLRLDLDFDLNASKVIKWLMALDTYSDVFHFQYYHSLKPYTYKHLFNISVDDFSFVVGLGFVGFDNKENKHGFIEFNPNKLENSYDFRNFRTTLFNYCDSVKLVRYDLAIDLPFPRSSVKLVRNSKKLYSYLIKDTGVTEYSGRRSNAGFIKLYDKTIESDLSYPLTRLEITLDSSSQLEDFFPEVWIYDQQYKLLLDDSLSSTQKVLVRLIREADIPSRFLKDLNPCTYQKIKPFLYDKKLLLASDCWRNVRSLARSYCF